MDESEWNMLSLNDDEVEGYRQIGNNSPTH